MRVFEFIDYKKYVNERVQSMPQRGRGQFRQIANYLKISSVVVSQIFKGNRDLSADQSYLLTKHFGMNEQEQEYFILLVQKSRASHYELQKYFDEKLKKIRNESNDLKNIKKENRLDEEAQSIFYTNWYYSAIRLSTAIPGNETVDKIAHNLKLPRNRVQQVVDFLLSQKLVTEENGKLKIGIRRTHLDASSPFVNRHHINWRLKGMENMDELKPHEQFYTFTMAVTEETLSEIKKLIIDFIAQKDEILKKSSSKKLACLNIDLFEL